MPITLAGTGAVSGANTINGLSVPVDSLSPALVLINSTTLSAVSSVSLNNVFTSTYQAYRIVVDVVASAAAVSYVRLRSNGTDDTSTNYHQQRITAGSTTLAGSRVVSGNNFRIGDINTTRGITWMDISDPMLPQATVITQMYGWGTGSCELGMGFHEFDSVATFDGITFYPSTGTMTGNMRVYGYKGS
jgi:hypothetical protein